MFNKLVHRVKNAQTYVLGRQFTSSFRTTDRHTGLFVFLFSAQFVFGMLAVFNNNSMWGDTIHISVTNSKNAGYSFISDNSKGNGPHEMSTKTPNNKAVYDS